MTVALYRPFCKQRVYFDRQLNDMVYRLDRIFPTPDHQNVGFYVTGVGSDKPFSVLATDVLPDLAFWGSSNGQFLARYTYVQGDSTGDLFSEAELGTTAAPGGWTQVDNISDDVLADYRAAYGQTVTKDDVFAYVYGLLHSSDYRVAYAADLKKMLPRIPKVASLEDFRAFVDAGTRLAALHVGYEAVEPYPLREVTAGPVTLRVVKMRFGKRGKDKDRSTVVYNSSLTLTGIPEQAHEYMLALGGRVGDGALPSQDRQGERHRQRPQRLGQRGR